jgi:hypothetical protein
MTKAKRRQDNNHSLSHSCSLLLQSYRWNSQTSTPKANNVNSNQGRQTPLRPKRLSHGVITIILRRRFLWNQLVPVVVRQPQEQQHYYRNQHCQYQLRGSTGGSKSNVTLPFSPFSSFGRSAAAVGRSPKTEPRTMSRAR